MRCPCNTFARARALRCCGGSAPLASQRRNARARTYKCNRNPRSQRQPEHDSLEKQAVAAYDSSGRRRQCRRSQLVCILRDRLRHGLQACRAACFVRLPSATTTVSRPNFGRPAGIRPVVGREEQARFRA